MPEAHCFDEVPNSYHLLGFYSVSSVSDHLLPLEKKNMLMTILLLISSLTRTDKNNCINKKI
jgi:hypothetical protein